MTVAGCKIYKFTAAIRIQGGNISGENVFRRASVYLYFLK